eukprot:15900-Heterococcus_DN1.PRE.4
MNAPATVTRERFRWSANSFRAHSPIALQSDVRSVVGRQCVATACWSRSMAHSSLTVLEASIAAVESSLTE